jgi:hypothetical protein
MSLIKKIKAELLTIEKSQKKLKQFGLLLALVLAAYGIIFFSNPLSYLAIAISIALVIIAESWIELLERPYILWMGIAVVIGYFMFRFFLVVFYYCGIVPVGILMKLFGRDPLHRDFSKKKETYWIPVHHKSNPELPY